MARKKPSPENYDVIIVGGGLAGLTMACRLGTDGLSVLCLDREALSKTIGTAFDGRATVISYGSRLVLEKCGLWDILDPLACPILDIKILDGSSPVLMSFLAEEAEGKAFGFNVENRLLRGAFLERVKELPTVMHLSSTEVSGIDTDEKQAFVQTTDGRIFTSPLIIGADGRNSTLRKFLGIRTYGWDYGQTALAFCITHENPHDNTAIEHFRRAGPFAILPLTTDEKNRQRSNIVWTVEKENLAGLLAMNSETFTAAVQARVPASYGRVALASERFSYPLSLRHAVTYTGQRAALIAEAAHAMHPIAGQGLNIGMRDIDALSSLVVSAKETGDDLGSEKLLSDFRQSRRFDTMAMMASTDLLNRVFSNSGRLLGGLRRLGVVAISRNPRLKGFFMRQAMGLRG